MSAVREYRDTTLELSAHAAAEEGSPKVSQGANSGTSKTPAPNSRASSGRSLAPTPNSTKLQTPKSKTATKKTEKDAYAGAKNISNLKCFYCHKKITKSDKGVTCPDGPARFDFKKGELCCHPCIADLQKIYDEYIADCTKRFGLNK